MISRPPIVTVLGHVDHGKTTLLDAVRKTSVAAKEAGGITQSIGASVVTTKDGKKITFIDTPGHAAFSKMRSRGAKVADIALLVVGADDGVKPQTLEALKAIKEADIPFIVVATKMDLPSASIETVQGQLEKEGILFEGRGGDTPILGVSAKKNEGIEELLDLITLLADVTEVKSDQDGPLQAVIIETSKDQRGPIASVVVRNGTLKVADEIIVDDTTTKIRALFDENNKPANVALPGTAVAILGFAKLPAVGSVIGVKEEGISVSEIQKSTPQRVKVQKGQLPILVKAKNAGSLEAILTSVPKEVVVINSGVGDVYESDVLDAKALGAIYIFAFESKASVSVLKLSEAEGIKIETFNVIYELFDRMNELIKVGQEEILGKAEILATFPYEDKKVAGCKVISGKISKSDKLILTRSEKRLGEASATSMKKGKTDILEAKMGEEFGVVFEPQLDFAIGDMIVSVAK